MARPVIGIIGNFHLINDQYPAHTVGAMDCCAVSDVAKCTPLAIPANPNFVNYEDLLEICDGFLFTGGRPNVHPEEYGEEETEAHGAFDRNRDAVTLPLIRAAVERGLPILGVCRGFQEVNVAMGGSLYPEIRDLPGRMNHRMPPDGTLEEKFAPRHVVRFTQGGPFQRLYNSAEVTTNSLHGQGLKTLGRDVVVDGWAPDDTPEAIYIKGARGFTLSVQWHPEYRAAEDPVSRLLYETFGRAAHAWQADGKPMPVADVA